MGKERSFVLLLSFVATIPLFSRCKWAGGLMIL